MSSSSDQIRLALRRPSPLRYINYDWLTAAAALPGKTARFWFTPGLQFLKNFIDLASPPRNGQLRATSVKPFE